MIVIKKFQNLDKSHFYYKCEEGKFFFRYQNTIDWQYTPSFKSWEELDIACKKFNCKEILIHKPITEIDYLDAFKFNFKDGG